jgi:hypothetical protein
MLHASRFTFSFRFGMTFCPRHRNIRPRVRHGRRTIITPCGPGNTAAQSARGYPGSSDGKWTSPVMIHCCRWN